MEGEEVDVKELLRRAIKRKQGELGHLTEEDMKQLELERQERAKKREEERRKKEKSVKDRRRLEEWKEVIESLGYPSTIFHLNWDSSLTLRSSDDDDTSVSFAISVLPSNTLSFTSQTGPYSPVRLYILPNGSWSLHSEVLEFRTVAEGSLDLSKSDQKHQLSKLLASWLSPSHVLCPGIIYVLDVEEKLGYIPKMLEVIQRPMKRLQSRTCKLWHVPTQRSLTGTMACLDKSDPRWKYICSECRLKLPYVLARIEAKSSRTSVPSRNVPFKFLTPAQRQQRRRNECRRLSRLKRRMEKLCKKAKIELTDCQSEEFSAIIEAMEESDSEEEEEEELEELVMEENGDIKEEKGVP